MEQPTEIPVEGSTWAGLAWEQSMPVGGSPVLMRGEHYYLKGHKAMMVEAVLAGPKALFERINRSEVDQFLSSVVFTIRGAKAQGPDVMGRVSQFRTEDPSGSQPRAEAVVHLATEDIRTAGLERRQIPAAGVGLEGKGMAPAALAAVPAEKVLPGNLTPGEKALLEEMAARIDVLDEMGKSPVQIHDALEEEFGARAAGMSGSPAGLAGRPAGLDEQERGQQE